MLCAKEQYRLDAIAGFSDLTRSAVLGYLENCVRDLKRFSTDVPVAG